MTNDCKDRDLLVIEPTIFTGGGFGSQQLAEGTDGTLSQGAFASASADFVSTAVQAGMVLCVYTTVPAESRSYEILSVDSGTELAVSILRPERDGGAIAPPSGTELKYYINTFAPQILAAQATLQEKLRQIAEAEGITSADFVDSMHFRKVVSLATLAAIFTALASNAVDTDANWVKADHYRRLHKAALPALRLARDIDGDGLAESTRTLGNVSLRRT